MGLVLFLLVVAAGGVGGLTFMPPGSVRSVLFFVTLSCILTSISLVAMEWRRSWDRKP